MADLGLWPGKSDFWHRAAVAWATEHPNDGAVLTKPPVQTVFTVSYRYEGLNLEEPRIKDGLRITKLSLKKIKAQADRSGTKLLVVLIPTKESVYADLISKENQAAPPNYVKLVEMEAIVRADVKAFCDAENIATADALPKFRTSIAQDQAIYPTTTESHPNAHGYAMLAELVNDELEALAWLK